MTLRWRMTLAFVSVVLVPLVLGAVLVTRSFPQALQARQQASVASAVRLVSQVLRDYCERATSAAQSAGRAATTLTPAEATAAGKALVQDGAADGVRVTGVRGVPVVSAGQVPVHPVDCVDGRATDRYLSAVVTLHTPAGAEVGTAVVSFDLAEQVESRLRAALGDTDLTLQTPGGSVVARTTQLATEVRAAALRHPAGVRTDGLTVAGMPSGDRQPYDVVVAERAVRQSGLLAEEVGVFLVALVGAFALALASARATTRPLEQLSEAAARVAAGDLSTTIEVRSKDEIGRLALAFNAMTEDLRDYVGQLHASRDDLQNGLMRLGETLAGSHDLVRILNVVLESAISSTRATGGMVLLVGPEVDELSLAVSQGIEVPTDLRIRFGEGVSGRVAETGEPVRGRVGHGPQELWPASGEPSGVSCIVVPMMLSGRVRGVLDLFGSELPGGFDDTDLATMRTFATQATAAVDNVMLHEEAQRLSTTDGLTGLWNFRYFTSALHREVERAMRFGRPLALLMLDLDHFKDVNDSYGHQRGDAVLVELAARLRAEARDVDTVARYGGEELVVVLPETDQAGARQAAERFCEAVRSTPFGAPGLAPIHLTVSAGVAVFPEHGGSADSLIAAADSALYEAKHAGRDTWRVSPEARSG